MKKIILTFTLLLTISFAFATNEVEKISTFDVEETLSVELTEVDLTMEVDLTEILLPLSKDEELSFVFDTCESRKCVIIDGESYCTEWKEVECE
ncbi:MAG: hypothetical protein L3J20_04885 [Flavobacteriaceae bacterium]|nr:hypothetical protein [Flavobacteriaceae bacterium]